MISAIKKEIFLRKEELENKTLSSLYFGGGTPSILSVDEIKSLIDEVLKYFDFEKNIEITLEANPDDLTEERIVELSTNKVNRLSIGIQSFFEDDLKLMNRAHNVAEAKKCLEIATKYFDNITIDLIYGIPGSDLVRWAKNLEFAFSLPVSHLSCYGLTLEPKTKLNKMVSAGEVTIPSDEHYLEQFGYLMEAAVSNGFEHYEISNFAKPGFRSKHNSRYWSDIHYMGVGPSAHSYNGYSRQWNVSNNSLYIKSIQENKLPIEIETLTKTDRYNEYIMTGLRTIWGVSLERIEQEFGKTYLDYLLNQSKKHIEQSLLEFVKSSEVETVLKTTKKGKFLSDGIASDLFLLNLE